MKKVKKPNTLYYNRTSYVILYDKYIVDNISMSILDKLYILCEY